MGHLLLNQTVPHNERMPTGEDEKVGHPGKLRPCHRNFTVAGSWEKSGKAESRPVAGENSQRKGGGPQAGGRRLFRCPQLTTRWSKKQTKPGKTAETIDQLAALIRRTEHHHPPQIGRNLYGQIGTEQNAAHGMGDEMNTSNTLPPQGGDCRWNDRLGEDFDGVATRGITGIDDTVSLPLAIRCQRPHRPAGPGQTMKQDHSLMHISSSVAAPVVFLQTHKPFFP